MDFWNQRELPHPPVNTYKSITLTQIDLDKLRKTLLEGQKHFKTNEFFVKESALLARILYRMKMKFRSAKDFKLLQRLKRCLDSYFKSNLILYFKEILAVLPQRHSLNMYLPTKSMLEYILVRLQGLVKLMECAYDTCQYAAKSLAQRLQIGHFWKIFLILFGLVSRLAVIIKFNTKFMCDLYAKLLPHTTKLKNPFAEWLPRNYELPKCLILWLGVDWMNEEDVVDLTLDTTTVDFFDLIDDDEEDVEFCNEYILLEDEEIVKEFKELPPVRGFGAEDEEEIIDLDAVSEDIGEELSSSTEEVMEVLEESIVEVTPKRKSDNSGGNKRKKRKVKNTNQKNVIVVKTPRKKKKKKRKQLGFFTVS